MILSTVVLIVIWFKIKEKYILTKQKLQMDNVIKFCTFFEFKRKCFLNEMEVSDKMI